MGTTSVGDYTIEHIMPQNEDLSAEWRRELGEDEWVRIHETYLHTVGNLTLTAYNSEFSDHSFAKKRDMVGGFRDSPLRVNKGLGEIEQWNEESIAQRAERMAEVALEVWCTPELPEDVLEGYQTAPDPTAEYSIEDHPYLEGGLPRDLFEALRREVKALDPCVSEEFLKKYVAFKAESNFVDVEPQASGLRLSLNLPFSELNDPRKWCRDITNIGRWGNGDADVTLKSLDDLPYILGLVRQALESQLGN